MVDEKTPLLQTEEDPNAVPTLHSQEASKPSINPIKKLSNALIGAIRAVFSTIFAPGYYIIACFYDDEGNFSTFMPLRYASRAMTGKSRQRSKRHATPMEAHGEKSQVLRGHSDQIDDDHPARHTRSHSTSSSASDDGDLKPKRAIRIKTLNDQALRERERSSKQPTLTVDTIKSPTSASNASKIMKYPRAPAPPRPLIPKRQPSYSVAGGLPAVTPQKTLIIDLDETLIHSMAKGGRMSTGHMVEVKLQTPVGVGGGVLGPQVPILYWVNKRPYCDEFLRKVSPGERERQDCPSNTQ